MIGGPDVRHHLTLVLTMRALVLLPVLAWAVAQEGVPAALAQAEGAAALGRVEHLVTPPNLLADPPRRVLYAVHGDEDYASAFAVAPAGIRSHERAIAAVLSIPAASI